MIQNVYADAEDSKESADTETSDSVLDQATIMYQQYNYDEAIKLLKKRMILQKIRLQWILLQNAVAKNHWLNNPLEKNHTCIFHTLIVGHIQSI